MISLSVKTLLKHVGLKLFLLNSARLLSVKRGILMGVRAGCMLGFELLLLSTQPVIYSQKESISKLDLKQARARNFEIVESAPLLGRGRSIEFDVPLEHLFFVETINRLVSHLQSNNVPFRRNVSVISIRMNPEISALSMPLN